MKLPKPYSIETPDFRLNMLWVIQELENAPTSKAMFLIEYAMEGRSPVLVITYQKDFSFLKGTAEGPKTH